MLLQMDDPMMQEFGNVREGSIGHPDQTDVANACMFATEIIEKIS